MNLKASGEQIMSGLIDADVRVDAAEQHLARARRRELRAEFGRAASAE